MVTFLHNMTSESLVFSSSYSSIIRRFLLVFGSICFFWLILGLIFVSIQTFRHWKKYFKSKFARYHHRSIPNTGPPTTSLDDNDDQQSVLTSVSFLSERDKNKYDHTPFSPAPCERIPEEEFELDLPTPIGMSNLAFSTSTIDAGRSLLYYPACRNFAYSQSTLASSMMDFNPPISTPKRNSSQSSTTTAFSQITNATFLSSSSASTIPQTSMKIVHLLPTVMITDCDRLQTDIIELDEFEPEKDWRRARPELRLLLNDRLPQAISSTSMALYGSFPSVRHDFRCAVCQRKNAFHCEHDTPCRDNYLVTHQMNTSNRRSSPTRHQTSSRLSKVSSSKSTTRKHYPHSASAPLTHPTQPVTVQTSNTSSKPKSKTCVIL